MTNMTQKQWVMDQLESNGHITRNECLRVYISRLSAIIQLLEEDGYIFDRGFIDVATPWGGVGKDYKYTVRYNPNVDSDTIQ